MSAAAQVEAAPVIDLGSEKVDPIAKEKKPEEQKPSIPAPSTETPEKKLEEAIASVASAPISDPDTAEKKDEPSKKEVEEATATVAAAQTSIPGAPTSTQTGEPTWPETTTDHPLTTFFEFVPELTEQAAYNEVYGIILSKTNPFHTKLILQKFLRANSNDLSKAKDQLLDTLKWRKEFQPSKAANEKHDPERFAGLGYILDLENVPDSANKKDIVTFNIYGAVKDNKKTFGDLDGFLRWRVGLMERSVQKLGLETATQPIPDFGQGPDPYQGFQVHDYLQVSFIRMDPNAKAASKKTIETFQRYYPETLSRKFFVNVPVVMGWLFSAMKLFVAKETIKKFTVLSYGNQLAAELGPAVPNEYGGTLGELKEVGETL
ncbi:phosphatidylinositol transfer protein SFH5 [Lojkania enalia]|uniref:Phosphatidylinositol transfer protein SFH5 n=1 Tax=Lojkania enalia TaxID=147567 RepID=A0A9P4K467_9PLEO|nr:phosphatidylinositol transfer protein SFH5 [Didymosphaeria enalia]